MGRYFAASPKRAKPTANSIRVTEYSVHLGA
jgi:hypothetical protein